MIVTYNRMKLEKHLQRAYVCQGIFRKNSLWIGMLNFTGSAITLPH